MWAVLYGGRFDGHAVLVNKNSKTLKFPEKFDLKRDVESHDFGEGDFEYERTTARSVGWNVSGAKQRGLAFTPRVLETQG